jgi:hypothetical protein
VFQMDVAKVHRDVAYVAIVVHVCYKVLFSMFYFFRRMLQVCLSECCICFHTYIANVLSECCICFAIVSSVFQVFLQVFQTHVLNVSLSSDLCYNFASRCFKTRSGMASLSSPSTILPLASVSGAGSDGRRRWSPLALVVPTCRRERAQQQQVGSKWARNGSRCGLAQ